jgi:hypothetical protein
MRPLVALVSVLAGALSACAGTGPSRLGYAPPAERPEQPGAGYVGQPAADVIWDQLLDRLIQAGLRIDLAAPERGVMVASYSGDPSPYVSCGWILLYGDEEPERIDASSGASFARVVGRRAFEFGPDLKLDARLVVQIRPNGGDALVEASSNYVLTQTVAAASRPRWRRGPTHEFVSFSTGERAAFSKGTVCQPNGALERIVLDILPPATQAARSVPSMGPAPTRRARIVETELASDDVGRQALESDDLGQEPSAGSDLQQEPPPSSDLEEEPFVSAAVQEPFSSDPQQELSASEGLQEGPSASRDPQGELPTGSNLRQAPSTSGDPRQAALASSDLRQQSDACAIADKVFCEVLEVTGPYRRANEERGLGLEVDDIEGGSPLLGDSRLALDIGLPTYDAYLVVSYFLRDGTVRHVRSGSGRRWPANAREFIGDAGLDAGQSEGVEMVVAVASDVPLFTPPRPPSEAAETYLADLRRRLAEMTGGAAPAQIAASLVVITPAQQAPS